MNENARPEPVRHGPDLGAVLGGLVVLALAAAVAVHEVAGLSWDWRYWAAGILLVAGLAVVTSAVAAAVSAHLARLRGDGEAFHR
ncbi:hypothetical protein [Kineococcus sp. SYSU DK003]|uniref:hypothetical protein n=1 Tax=Kineococcus sp. SYSU DK003 TaxID=3383124 RepID=UPI003D7EEC7C